MDSPVRLPMEHEPETRLLTEVVYPSAVGPGTTCREQRQSLVKRIKRGAHPARLALVRTENQGVKGV